MQPAVTLGRAYGGGRAERTDEGEAGHGPMMADQTRRCQPQAVPRPHWAYPNTAGGGTRQTGTPTKDERHEAMAALNALWDGTKGRRRR